jgi:gamma-D-glutamyl-L-lysine dipeptidyl-peptidase
MVCLVVACTAPPAQIDATVVENILLGIQQHFVPDRRVARLEVTIVPTAAGFLLRGESTLPAARDSLLHALAANGIAFVDSIQSLPAADLGPDTLALTRHSVANLRSERGHSQELATQVLLGTPLRVLRQEAEWYLVQCPDGYLAWLHGGELVRQSVAARNEWKAADRVVYTADYGHSYTAPNTASTPVGDLVKGGLLVRLAEQGDFTQVAYPDGRLAFVPTQELQPFATWLTANLPDFARTRAVATDQLGKPYLWGGTSPKGMDCSGFTKTVYWQQGLIIPRDASQQVHAGLPVVYDEQLHGLQAGDFLFFGRLREDGTEKITHVGIYLGEGAFIHSGADNGANKIQNLLPGQPDFAEHRRATLRQARRLTTGSPGVQSVGDHSWYW